MPVNTKESGLESLIIDYLVRQNGYELGACEDYSRKYAVDETRLFRFLETTQPEEYEKNSLGVNEKRVKFLDCMQREISKRGVIDILRKGISFYPANVTLFYGAPSPRNITAQKQFARNIFSVTRQLRYSKDQSRKALDFVIFINGLPVVTAELKNRWTNQNAEDAVRQYKTDRDPKELLFQFKRCLAHFAIDDAEVRFCTQLEGKDSWFLPFNKGCKDGAGNPPNPKGLAVAYLWEETFSKPELTAIIENYAQVVEEKNELTGEKKERQVFPRYHQLQLVKKLLADIYQNGVGGRYLVQHSAGSGKSNSIAWLAHQMVGMEKDGRTIVDSILVVTDRRILDKQIRNTIKQFMQVKNTVAWAEHSSDLKTALETGKKIIVTTIQKFPFIVDTIGTAHKDKRFAIIIDEAHSSQGGNSAAEMNLVLSGIQMNGEEIPGEKREDANDIEDIINHIIESRKLLSNASYFAFTATPKNKTLEMFGVPYEEDGKIKHRPFDYYSMKQAIEEGFILDVLQYYTPVKSFYRLKSIAPDDPVFDKKKAKKRLRRYVESHPDTIAYKAKIMVDHFCAHVHYRIRHAARAMIVTDGIERAIEYYYAVTECLNKRKSPYKAMIAFSGDKNYNGQMLNESAANGFPSNQIEKKFKTNPYRFLICADKFQTGYDEPLLHTLYVDKILAGIKAVQTLSRPNRSHPEKFDCFILDFANDPDSIKAAFANYYITTILSDETDPNKLNELITGMEKYYVYTHEDIEKVNKYFFESAGSIDRQRIDAALDVCAARYQDLDEDARREFKGCAKSFIQMYRFLAVIIPYRVPGWEKLSVFLTLLVPKLPSPKEEDRSKGILQAVDLDSYHAEMQTVRSLYLENKPAQIDPVAMSSFAGEPEPEYDSLSKIVAEFNRLFGGLFKNPDVVAQQIAALPAQAAQNTTWQNAKKNAGEDDARVESNAALRGVILDNMDSTPELFKQYSDNPSFKAWIQEQVFSINYGGIAKNVDF
jgi:type I restriction enzyme R subunit